MVNEYKKWDKETLVQNGMRLKYLINEAIELAKKEQGKKRDEMDMQIAKSIIVLHEFRKEYKRK